MNVIEILEKLVSFPVLGGESNLSIIHWIKEYIESHGVKTHLVPNADGTKASLHCRIGPAEGGGFILSGHTDVVPVQGQNWTSDPFILTDKGDGKLYARGSCDMKGFLACCLAVLPKMVASDLKKPIYFAFSYDEEVGCLAAPELAEAIKSHYTEKPGYAIIGEPSLLEPIIGQKGIAYVGTTVNGSAGHSSGIHKEISAIHESARLILWLEAKMNELAKTNTDDRFDPPHSTIHVGQVHGGIATNVVADHTYFEWDVRVIPKDSIQEIIEDYFEHCKQREQEVQQVFPKFRIENTIVHPAVPPLDTDEHDSIVAITQKITGNSTWNAVAYAAEAGQFDEAGFETIICGPGSIAQAHRADEFIAIDQLYKGVKMLENLIEELT
ncbi:MAG: acetylornithine deacetylase [Flavobacteriaceae bacterium]|nr:acetylornithine deacetylase [Flavobacteriaceae bacterium]